MIRVLIVDDDKLVRKGLISSMPWHEYGMEVVGEAKNGEKALEFVKNHPVDLMLVDLAMPVMSGIDLMRIVRKSHPHIFVVVLTMHQDFEYIQEALRLGAIDYIAKVELEREAFGTVLYRIRARIEEERQKPATSELFPAGTTFFPTDKAWVVMADLGRTVDMADIVKKMGRPAVITLTDLSVWPWPEEQAGRQVHAEFLQAAGAEDGIVLIGLYGVKGMRAEELGKRLQHFRERCFFYVRSESKTMYELSIDDLGISSSVEERDLSAWKTDALSLAWVHRVEEYEPFLKRLKTLALPPEQLNGLLRFVYPAWNSIYEAVTSKKLAPPDEFRDWETVLIYLGSARQQMLTALGKARFSAEVERGISRALKVMHERMSENVNAAEIAREVGMSRGYFSQCFKEWTGVTFNEYVRRMRMEKAKEYLRHTDHTIAWIAEQTGYADEKYFSRMFRRLVGMLPSEYRQMKREGRKMSGTEGED